MKKINQNSTTLYRRSYLISILLMLILIVLILASRESANISIAESDFTSIDNEWSLTLSPDDPADLTNLGQYYKEGSDTISLYWRMPYTIYDRTLIYRSKDVYTKILINGEEFYSTQYFDSPFYNKSPGNNWNSVTIPSKYSNEVIELQIKYAYDTKAVTVDHFYWGNKSDVVLHFYREKGLAILLSILLVVIGAVIMLMDRSSFEKTTKHGLLFLGIYAIMMGIWSLLETNLLQFWIVDGRLLQLLDNLLMIMDSLPLFFYLDAEFDIFKLKPLKIFCIIDIIYIYICLIGQITGLTDLHYMLKGSWIATLLSFSILICIFVRQIIKRIRGEKIKKRTLLQMLGFVSLMTLVAINIPVYIYSDPMDRASSIRFGMLIMILLFAVAGQIQTYELIMQGTRYSLIKDLAYQDGLTGLENRTSYLEKIEEYKINHTSKLGMVFFDVNYLKKTNDTLGHDAGDKLLCVCANIIKDGFEKFGHVYRIGGDEFVAIIDKGEPMDCYKEGMNVFLSEVEEANYSAAFPFVVEIAQGFAESEGYGENCIQDMIQTADSRMYDNKRTLKEASK